MVTPMKEIVRIAGEVRQSRNLHGGFVVMFNRAHVGWTLTLEHPVDWMPGCLAVDDIGNAWRSTGGDPYRGSMKWVRWYPEVDMAESMRSEMGIVGGYVIINDGRYVGVMPNLDNPADWHPGSVAVDSAGNVWDACVGDSSTGALFWEPRNQGDKE